MNQPSEWQDPIQRQVDKALQGIPKYWGRPTRTHYATTTINSIINGTQPAPKGWNQPQEPTQ